MQFMLLIYSAEGTGPQPGSDEFGAFMKGYVDFTETVKKDGKMVAGDALQPIATATTVSVRGGKSEIMDGPFAETKDIVSGYLVLTAEDLNAATVIAQVCPAFEVGGWVEVREIEAG